ncbi:MAG: DegV family protein [Lachnospiraceae bacterium]|jgi:DegV family protein with EDD domain|nr:DegV family protein [Lachnospiraceae bacterium]
MPQIAIVTDSNSGIKQTQGQSLGVYVIPMPFYIDDALYYEDINLTVSEFYEHLANGANIATSQPSPETVCNFWTDLLKTYDSVVHIPMSSGLSGACENAMMLARDFDGRVEVVNNQRISVTQRQSVLDAVELANRGKSAQQIKQILEADKFESSIYIMLNTLLYLKKGGRITPAAAALGTLLKIKPVLQVHGEKLDAFAKARTVAQGKSIMEKAIQHDLEKRFKAAYKKKAIWLQIAHTQNEEAAMELRDELSIRYPEFPIYVDQLSLSVACHIGPGSLAIACCVKMDYDAI